MAGWEIQQVSKAHDCSRFDCGNRSLNEWLKKRAGQWQRKELSRCYVAVQRGQTEVSAYYAISSHHVSYAALATDQAKGLPRMDVRRAPGAPGS